LNRAGKSGRHERFSPGAFIILNLAIDGTTGGDPTATEFPARFEVDYVRIYQKELKRAKHATPCRDCVEAPSNCSIPFHPFLVFPITWGICSSLDSQPKWPQQMGFWNSFGSVEEQVR
jgi:hypothetical protein